MLDLICILIAAQDQDPLRVLVETNPEIEAAEALEDAANAEARAARGARLPQLSVQAQTGTLEEAFRVQNFPGALSATRDPTSAALVAEQALFTSGRIGGAVGAARAEAHAAGHDAERVRQDVVLSGAVAIADLVRDRAVLAERRQNEETVAGRLEEAKARRQAGVATLTDLRQSEARLALAAAERAAAEGTLARAEAAYARVFGEAAPERLTLPAPPAVLPSSLEDALGVALSENPELLAQMDRRVAAKEGVKAARGAVLPQIGLTASAAYSNNERFGLELGEAEQYAVFLTGRWDLFDGGTGYARAGAAKRRAAAEVSRTRGLERDVRERTLAGWADLHTSRAAVEARSRQVEAARLARDGVIQEFEAGRRTRLDVLDADRELTDAEVGLLSARRDRVISEFSILRAMGKL